MTPLDTAFTNADASDQAMLNYYERLVEAELFLMLEAEPTGDKITPVVFDTQDGQFALVFDTQERLAEFASSRVPFVALSGRNIVGMLADAGIGLGVNLDVALSSNLLPASIVGWLNTTLGATAVEHSDTPVAVNAPSRLPEILLSAIDSKLATMQGLAACAHLVSFEYADGSTRDTLAFEGALPDAHAAITNAISEALTFSGLEAGSLDIVFMRAQDPMIQALSNISLRFDLPKPLSADAYVPTAPGRDPNKPPKLV